MMSTMEYRLMSGQRLAIFISSTTSDLGDIRKEVVGIIIRLNQYPIAMDYGGANNESSLEVSLRYASECDVFVGLIGYRFGTSAPNDYYSITQREFYQAHQLGKYMLMYVPAGAEAYLPTEAKEKDVWRKQKEFIVDIQRKGHTYAVYSNLNQLPGLVATDLTRVLNGGAPGKVALKKGRQELFKGNYQAAIYDLSMAAQYLPNDGEAVFLQAIAMLHGRNPRAIIDMAEMSHINGLLDLANRLTPENRAFTAVLGAYICDSYTNSEMITRGQQLLDKAKYQKPEPALFALVGRLLPDFYDDYLHGLG